MARNTSTTYRWVKVQVPDRTAPIDVYVGQTPDGEYFVHESHITPEMGKRGIFQIPLGNSNMQMMHKLVALAPLLKARPRRAFKLSGKDAKTLRHRYKRF